MAQAEETIVERVEARRLAAGAAERAAGRAESARADAAGRAAERTSEAAILAQQVAAYQDRLIGVIQQGHEDSQTMAVAMVGVTSAMRSVETTMSLQVGLLTTVVNQARSGVPLNVFWAVTLLLIAIIAALIGLDATNVWSIGGTP